MRHHTKSIGDLGVAEVIRDLARSGIGVALPMSEHLPFDLVAIDENGRLARVQVKARSAPNGVAHVGSFTTWQDRNGTHRRKWIGGIDGLAVFIVDDDVVAYLSADELCGRSTAVRTQAPKNGQRVGVRMAEDHRDPTVMFVGE